MARHDFIRVTARCRAAVTRIAFPCYRCPQVSDRLAVMPQYLLPKRLLTQLMGRLADLRGGAITHAVIRKFVAHYHHDGALVGVLGWNMPQELRSARALLTGD